MENRIIEEAIEYIRTLFQGNCDGHDFDHTMRVYCTAMEIAETEPRCDKLIVALAALLHDVGRVQGDMDIMGKVLAVLVKHFAPVKARQLAETKTGWLGHILYVYYQHPEIGAMKLEGIGMKEEAAIIRCHHRKKTENDPPELALLRAADELN